MNGIHILSTSPSGERPFSPQFFEVASYVLSALLWKRFNGGIKLYTDDIGLEYLMSRKLDSLWDSIDDKTLNAIPKTIDQQVFWASAKLFALRVEQCPVAMLDGDLFIWKDIRSFCENKSLVTLHREDLIDCYPPKEQLNTAIGYSFGEWMDWTVRPCNTAFAYFSNESLKSFYISEAIRFMEGNSKPSMIANSQMVFAEQRLLAMCAKEMSVEIVSLVGDPFDSTNDLFTHLWGAKRLVRRDEYQRQRLEEALLRKVKAFSEEYYNLLCEIR